MPMNVGCHGLGLGYGRQKTLGLGDEVGGAATSCCSSFTFYFTYTQNTELNK